MGTLRFPILGLGITQRSLLYPARSCSELSESFRQADIPHGDMISLICYNAIPAGKMTAIFHAISASSRLPSTMAKRDAW